MISVVGTILQAMNSVNILGGRGGRVVFNTPELILTITGFIPIGLLPAMLTISETVYRTLLPVVWLRLLGLEHLFWLLFEPPTLIEYSQFVEVSLRFLDASKLSNIAHRFR